MNTLNIMKLLNSLPPNQSVTIGDISLSPSQISLLLDHYVLSDPPITDNFLDFYKTIPAIIPLSDYMIFPNQDSPNNDLSHHPGLSIPELKELCNKTPAAIGFNSNGWLKSKICHHKVSNQPCDLYVSNKRKTHSIPGYIFHEELDSFGNDISHYPSASIDEIHKMCESKSGIAFNTLGWIKSSVGDLVNLYGQGEGVKDGFKDGIYIKDVSSIIDLLNNPPSSRTLSNLTFTITTCKRLDRFIDTMTNLLLHIRDPEIIDEWILIDDNSSEEDREYMKLHYPFFTFIFKTPDQKGHANSLNMLWNVIKTDYVIHFEDDWKCNEIFSIKEYLDFVKETDYHLLLRKICWADHEYIKDIGGKKVFKYMYNKNHNIKPTINRLYDNICISNDSADNNDGDDDSFTDKYWWWPNGFSLNVSIFNFKRVKELVGYFKPQIKQELFEYDFAVRANQKHIKMAYVDLNINHTGVVSSYKLNDMKRSYD